ncbi:MAG: type II toxin-antitoxin system RelE/ParE family toxin [Bryobacteraceae bacterium]
MNQPTFRLHPLKGNRKGVWAVTVRANWRVTFRFEGGEDDEDHAPTASQRDARQERRHA